MYFLFNVADIYKQGGWRSSVKTNISEWSKAFGFAAETDFTNFLLYQSPLLIGVVGGGYLNYFIGSCVSGECSTPKIPIPTE